MDNYLVGQRIEQRRKECGMTLDDIAQEIGVARSTIQRYEKGSIDKIKLPIIEAIARVLGVNPAWICGKSDTMDSEGWLPSNMQTLLPMSKVPLVGRIACGTPITAEENIEDYIDLPRHIQADFALECKGDSMIGAGIRDGDMVYIKIQPEVENGQIAAVLVDGDEATLKRFYFDGQTVQLVAENPRYAPMVFVGEDIDKRLRIIGRAVAYTHAIKE